MKLASRFTLAFTATLAVMLSGHGALRWRRESALFQADIARDHQVLGNGLALATSALWLEEGEARALSFLAAADARRTGVQIRAVQLQHPAEDRIPMAPPALLQGLDERGVIEWRGPDPADPEVPRLYTYVPLEAPPGQALELSESLAGEARYRKISLAIVAFTTLAVAGVAAWVSSVLGRLFVTAPVEKLIAQARRVGAGDFAERLDVRGDDELAELAGALNRMVDQLQETRARLAEEAAGRRVAQEQLVHANRLISVGRLASGVIHEVGTPLTVISARARMIRSGELAPEEVGDNARIIDEQSARIAGILRRVLDFSRAGRLEHSPVELNALAARTLELLTPLARKHQATLSLKESPEALFASADANEIQQALSNLVMNALQAMPSGGAVELRVAAERRGRPGGAELQDWVILEVRDQGEGVPEEHLSRLFEPFFTTKAAGQGTGLGLSVSHDILEAHGGFIAVESQRGAGARFTLHLPRVAEAG